MSSVKESKKDTPTLSDNNDIQSDTELLKVHSANSWETAELGDDSRKNKFLRLMGAAKNKDHHGKLVIGDHAQTHARPKTDTEKISNELESQYQEGLSLKLSGGARAHKGLGFHEEKPSSETTEKPRSETTEKEGEKCSETDKKNETDNNKQSQDSIDSKEPEKRKFEECPKSENESKPTSEKKMKFVKSSS